LSNELETVRRIKELERRLALMETKEFFQDSSHTHSSTPGDFTINGRIVVSTATWGSWERTTDTNLDTSVFYEVPWESENADTDAMWSSGTDININTAGVYIIKAELAFEGNSSGTRQCIIYDGGVGGTTIGAVRLSPAGTDVVRVSTSAIQIFTASGLFSVVARQDSGSSIDLVEAKLQVARIA